MAATPRGRPEDALAVAAGIWVLTWGGWASPLLVTATACCALKEVWPIELRDFMPLLFRGCAATVAANGSDAALPRCSLPFVLLPSRPEGRRRGGCVAVLDAFVAGLSFFAGILPRTPFPRP